MARGAGRQGGVPVAGCGVARVVLQRSPRVARVRRILDPIPRDVGVPGIGRRPPVEFDRRRPVRARRQAARRTRRADGPLGDVVHRLADQVLGQVAGLVLERSDPAVVAHANVVVGTDRRRQRQEHLVAVHVDVPHLDVVAVGLHDEVARAGDDGRRSVVQVLVVRDDELVLVDDRVLELRRQVVDPEPPLLLRVPFIGQVLDAPRPDGDGHVALHLVRHDGESVAGAAARQRLRVPLVDANVAESEARHGLRPDDADVELLVDVPRLDQLPSLHHGLGSGAARENQKRKSRRGGGNQAERPEG